MRSKNIVVALCLLLSGHVSAQDFSQGKVITNGGDTIHCMIKSGKWDINPNRIVTKLNDKTKKYWPTEIASFQVDNRTYVSARVWLDISNHIDGTLDLMDSRPKYEKDSVFAELILKGKKNLYRYKSPSYKVHFFVGAQGDRLEPLIYKRYLVWVDVGVDQTFKQVAYNEEYKNQLEVHFADCADFKSKIALTGYDAGQLSSLFRLYYSCGK
jgi:hypothetical protein